MKTTVIRTFLRDNNLTINDLARAIGMNAGTLKAYMSGANIPAKWVVPIQTAFRDLTNGSYMDASVADTGTMNTMSTDVTSEFGIVRELLHSKDVSERAKIAFVSAYIR